MVLGSALTGKDVAMLCCEKDENKQQGDAFAHAYSLTYTWFAQ
jgi:hypothetical protein